MAFLMCRDTVVYETTTKRVVNAALLPFCGSYEAWRKKRTYVVSNIDARNEDLCLPANAIEKRRRLSLSDCYWIKHNGDKAAFNAITPYRNPFVTCALTHRGSASPDLVTGGSMCKHWERLSDGSTMLCKSGKREWVNAEGAALNVARLLGFTVGGFSYRSNEDGMPDILLANISNERNMLLTLGGFGEKCNGYSPKSAAAAYARLGIVQKAALDYALRVVLLDAVVSNYDRKSNMGNWGFYKDSSTGAVALAPVFDFNLCHPSQPHMFISEVARTLRADALSVPAITILGGWLRSGVLPSVWSANANGLVSLLNGA